MKTVYLCMSADVIHNGHIKIISRAAELGELTVGVLTDEAVATYKRYPLIPFEERCEIIRSIKGVANIVKQSTLSYNENLQKLKPDYVVHGDNWRTGVQSTVREQVIEALKAYGGELVEFPYTAQADIADFEKDARKILAMPERRRPRLRELLKLKPVLSILEAHNGLTGLIVENTTAEREGHVVQFDGMWVSSLCDSTAKGKPDIELVDITSRVNTIEQIMEVTTKPIILDGDTGGMLEHFPYLVKTLERIGVSAVIIEDKEGFKQNSLFGTSVKQTQASIETFSKKIMAGKAAQTTPDFMIFARIESLVLEQGLEDALARARAFVKAGADGILIHSKSKTPDEVFEFLERFRAEFKEVPIAVVPTTYNTVTEEELGRRGVNIVIHANHLIRSAFPAMEKTAKTILENGRSRDVNNLCMSIKDILTLVKL